MSSTANHRLDIRTSIHGSNLPVLPPGIVYLLKALNNNDIHTAQLANELEKFPSIAIKIVAIANSPWSLPESPITNLPEACTRIGLNIVRSVSVALSISQVFDPTRCSEFSPKTFWTSALLNAEASFLCARDEPDICTNTARFAGLLHNIGLLWLANQKPMETKEAILDAQNNQDHSLSDSLIEKLDMDYYTVGGQLGASMELPVIITEAISTKNICATVHESPFINNHCYAKHLTATVLKHDELEDAAKSAYNENPHYQKLTEMLPKIQSMAESIF